MAEAEKESEITRGAGDKQSYRISAEAYTKDPEFYGFYRSMQAYRKALQGDDTTMVLSPDSEFFRYFGAFGKSLVARAGNSASSRVTGGKKRDPPWPSDLITALALVLVIEGALYALFPDAMKRAVLSIAEMPASMLRNAGLVAAVVGVAIVWLMRG